MPTKHNFFLSVIVPVKNREGELTPLLDKLQSALMDNVRDYEIIIVDTGSVDGTVSELANAATCYPNLQVICLHASPSLDVAAAAGQAQAIGDWVITLDPESGNPAEIPVLLPMMAAGTDVILAKSTAYHRYAGLQGMMGKLFHRGIHTLHGVRLDQDAPTFRALSRKATNFVLQFESPHLAFRALPALTQMPQRTHIYASAPFWVERPVSFYDRASTSLSVMTSMGPKPLRIASLLSLAGAALNGVYAVYVMVTWLLSPGTAPGWATLSLQQSGMYFLFSIVLFLLAEYVAALSRTGGAQYHISSESHSPVMTARQRINVEG